MAQSNFAYLTPSNDAAGLPLALSIFADRTHLRGQIGDDAQMAGLRLAQSGEMALLLTAGEASPLGDVVMVDCPGNDAAALAALARLDMRVAQAGAALVVSTSLAALDDVFGCLDQSGAQILVDPSRAERVLALGRALAEHSGARVRELSDEDRLALLRLTEQVSQIAQKLERLGLDRLGLDPLGLPAAASTSFRPARRRLSVSSRTRLRTFFIDFTDGHRNRYVRPLKRDFTIRRWQPRKSKPSLPSPICTSLVFSGCSVSFNRAKISRSRRIASVACDSRSHSLGGRSKPASWGHLKTGQS